MLDCGQAPIFAVGEPERIPDGVSRREAAARNYLGDDVVSAYGTDVVVVSPLGKILDRGEQSTVTDDVETGHIHLPPILS